MATGKFTEEQAKEELEKMIRNSEIRQYRGNYYVLGSWSTYSWQD